MSLSKSTAERNWNGKSVVVTTIILSGCAGGFDKGTDSRPIPLEAVINQMKCELALAFIAADRNKLTMTGWYIDGKMTAQVATSNKTEAGIGTPELVPLGSGGASGGFSINADITRSRTLKQVIDFSITPAATSSAVCDAPRAQGVKSVQSLGIFAWFESISAIEAGQPYITPTNLDYTLDFGVLRTGTAGADIAVVGIKGSAKATISRDDTQQLVLKFTPGEAAVEAIRTHVRKNTGNAVIVLPDGVEAKPFDQTRTLADGLADPTTARQIPE